MKGTTRLLALCGVLTALGVVLLCLGGIVPFALYICPILASITLLPVRSRPRYAWCCYGAIALLGLLLCPDKEVSLLFCFTGYYPLLKPRLDALRSRLLSLTLKLLWAAASMAALYALILYVFCLPAVVEEFAATGRWLLKKGLDEGKDQSYVLYNLTQEQLAHIRLPLGALHKTEVRKIAQEHSFINAQKHDSQDICFVPDGDYAGFIARYTGHDCPAGDFVDESGHVLGQHKGIVHYTVGQRKGLGIAADAPLYVKRIDAAENRVVLSGNDALFSRELTANDFNWIAYDVPPRELRATARVRYHQREQAATVTVLSDGHVHLVFDEPQRAITPGQAVVLYDGDTVLGGGTIL